MAHDVFISYSSTDKAIADSVCATLEGRRIRCWIAPRDITPGVPYGEALIEGLGASRLLVLVFSSHANVSRHRNLSSRLRRSSLVFSEQPPLHRFLSRAC